MYSVTVRDHVMIAHSFTGAVFGPAQALHGATYLVDVEFRRPELDPDGIVVDIGRATDVVKRVLGEINFKNLDEVPAFAGKNSTTEVVSRFVWDREQMLASLDRLEALEKGGARLFFGHDPDFWKDVPQAPVPMEGKASVRICFSSARLSTLS